MQRPSLWPLLVILLLGLLFLREPRLQRSEDIFLRWLIKNSQPSRMTAPLSVVEIGSLGPAKNGAATGSTEKSRRGASREPSPLESALFLQAALDFNPTVIAFESILKWSEREKDQVQIFIDQAMRVPKLLVGTELTATPDPDVPVPEIAGFTQVTGRRGNLVEFSGIERQPAEDLRLISTLGFVNLPNDVTDEIHVPLIFQYRGEVIPSFALQAALLWLRVPLTEVKIDIGSYISLPHGERIPIQSDGTALINPNAARPVRDITLNELFLEAQEAENEGGTALHLEDMRNQIVLARTIHNSTEQPDLLAATIATIQTNSFIRRVPWIYDCVVILLVAGLSGAVRQFSRVDLVLGAIAFSAAYCLIALTILARWSIWLPGCLPLGAVWVLVIFSLFLPKTKDAPQTVTIAAPPPAP